MILQSDMNNFLDTMYQAYYRQLAHQKYTHYPAVKDPKILCQHFHHHLLDKRHHNSYRYK